MYHHIFRFGGKVFSFVLAENKIVKAVEAHEDNPHEDWTQNRIGRSMARLLLVIHKRNKLPHSLPVSRYYALNALARVCVWTMFCLCSFLLFQMQFSISFFRWYCCSFCMRFASFIAIFGDVSFGCHTMFTQIDLFAFYRSCPEMVDFPTNVIIFPMSQLNKLHCISIDAEAEARVRYWSEKRWHQIWKFGFERMLNKMFAALHSAKFIGMEIDKICKSKFTTWHLQPLMCVCMHSDDFYLAHFECNAFTNHEIAHKLIFSFSDARDYE